MYNIRSSDGSCADTSEEEEQNQRTEFLELCANYAIGPGLQDCLEDTEVKKLALSWRPLLHVRKTSRGATAEKEARADRRPAIILR